KVEVAENRHLNVKKRRKIRLFDLIELFLEEHSKVNKNSYTDDIYRSNILKRYFGNIYIDKITPRVIESFKARMKNRVKESTINRYLTLLKTMYNKAIVWELVEDNPVSKVKLFKENNTVIRYLEKYEIGKLIECAPNEVIKGIIITAINTGMRKMEILNLKWADIDLERNILYIWNSKNKESRKIPINNVLLKFFKSYKDNIDAKSRYVFLNSKGKEYRDIRKPFKKALDNAGIKNFRFHDLRHTFASHLVMNGVEIMTISKFLGHKSIEMTMRYAHLSPGYKAKAIEKLNYYIE
ncbi:tyrosine-type recombinase/integrase, partial [Elusimicrobiota bacterium]